MNATQQNILDKNVFDYLEQSFKRIFSKDGQYKLLSSYIIGILACIVHSILAVGIFYCCITFSMQPSLSSGYLIFIMIFVLGILTVSLIESSFYAVVISKKFATPVIDNTESRGNTIFGNISLSDDVTIWKRYFSRYISYITLYSLITLVILLTVLFAFVFVELGNFWIHIVVLFIALYVLYRLSIAWYAILFEEKHGFLLSWQYLQGKVWSTVKKFFVFNWIVGIGSQIPFYIGYVVLPILSYKTTEILEVLIKNIHLLSVDFDKGTAFRYLPFNQLFHGIDFGNIDIGFFTLVILFYLFIIKIGTILKNAMEHTFGTNYFFDITQLLFANNQK